jgi:methanogenic corrinoid protein MtbC1
MTLEQLVEGAKSLPIVPADAAARYGESNESMVALVNADLQGRKDLARLIGNSPLDVMFANHANHAAFMSNVFSLGQNELLARTLPWVYRSYRGRGFSYDYFPVELSAWVRAVEACLPPGQAAPILAVYQWMLACHAEVVLLAGAKGVDGPDRSPYPSGPWAGMRERYLAALVAGDPAAALEIARAITSPADLESFFLSVIQPAMYEIGDRWEAGELSVAREHLASAITSRVVASLSTARNVKKPWRGRAVVSAAPNEFHELGAWMLSDLLEADGWEVSYLGANTPQEDLVEMVRDRRPAVVALSVTMPFNLDRTKAIIAALRAQTASGPVRILVGGRVFNRQPGLSEAVGADGWAENAHDAVLQARDSSKRARA